MTSWKSTELQTQQSNIYDEKKYEDYGQLELQKLNPFMKVIFFLVASILFISSKALGQNLLSTNIASNCNLKSKLKFNFHNSSYVLIVIAESPTKCPNFSKIDSLLADFSSLDCIIICADSSKNSFSEALMSSNLKSKIKLEACDAWTSTTPNISFLCDSTLRIRGVIKESNYPNINITLKELISKLELKKLSRDFITSPMAPTKEKPLFVPSSTSIIHNKMR
jgi:hypothetical protein